MQLKLLNDLGPRMKMFSWKCNHHVHSKGSAKKLHSISDIKQTVSVKKTSVKRILTIMITSINGYNNNDYNTYMYEKKQIGYNIHLKVGG